ncbi:MAG: aspartate aminotransferase family protein [Bacteroidota bacterium]|nr:aspartate aminotransferase family protein [Bacteroidota bacterium]
MTIESGSNTALHGLDKQYHLQTYNRIPVAFSHGKGARVWDVEGREYIDALAGIAVNCLGHCHPAVVDAVREQAGRLIHISNYFVSEPQVRLAQLLVDVSGMERVFFANSGTESIEGAFKFARKSAHARGRGGGIIAMEQSFHGRTLAAIATGGERMQRGFGPIPPGFSRVPFNDLAAVEAAITDDTAAVVVEPVQGEGGIHVANADFLSGLRALCDRTGALLIFDEIQCGIARTGKMFAKDVFGVQPDIMTLAKGLGGGIPIGAILCRERVAEAMEFGDHGTTFGGNPLATAAALATMRTLIAENFAEEAQRKGAWLRAELEKLKETHDSVREVRGLGLMLGVEFSFPTKPLMLAMLERGVLANATADNVLRLVPPLVITEEEMRVVVEVISAAITDVGEKA